MMTFNIKKYRFFFCGFLITVLLLMTILIGLVAYYNPTRNFPFVPINYEQPFFEVEQRYIVHSIMSNPNVDSLVLGTSRVRPLEPEWLNTVFGGKFSQGAIDSGQPYEQNEYLKYFLKKHPKPKTIIIGVDKLWCKPSPDFHKSGRPYSPPVWLFDDNTWNDLGYLFNINMLKAVGRNFFYDISLLKLGEVNALKPVFETAVFKKIARKIKYDPNEIRDIPYFSNGWGYIWPKGIETSYKVEKLRKNLYGDKGKREPELDNPPFYLDNKSINDWVFGTHQFMKEILSMPPEETKKVLIFVPYPYFSLGRVGNIRWAKYEECKHRFMNMAKDIPNTTIIDFMRDTTFTRTDEFFYDPTHVNPQGYRAWQKEIEKAVSGKQSENFKVLLDTNMTVR